jgi:hypothetical protein
MINHQVCGIDVRILDFFNEKGYVNKDNQINFVNYKITFKRFGKKYRRHGCKKRTLFDVSIRFWHSK